MYNGNYEVASLVSRICVCSKTIFSPVPTSEAKKADGPLIDYHTQCLAGDRLQKMVPRGKGY